MYLSVCISVRVCDRVTSCVGVNGSVWCVHVAWQPSSFVSCNLDPLHRSDCYGKSSGGDGDGEWCTHSLIDTLVHSLTHPPTYSFTHSCTRALTHSLEIFCDRLGQEA